MRDILRGTAVLVLCAGCSSTTLDVPTGHPASPDSPAGELAEPSPVLRQPPPAPEGEAEEADGPHDEHHGHHGHQGHQGHGE